MSTTVEARRVRKTFKVPLGDTAKVSLKKRLMFYQELRKLINHLGWKGELNTTFKPAAYKKQAAAWIPQLDKEIKVINAAIRSLDTGRPTRTSGIAY